MAAQGRDDAERAGVVAALGHLDVGVVRRRHQRAGRVGVVQVLGQRGGVARGRRGAGRLPEEAHRHAGIGLPGGRRGDRAHDVGHLAGAQHGVDLADLRLQFAAVALRQAAGDDEFLAAPGLLQLGELQDRVHRLLLGRVDERAGVDHEHVGRRRVGGDVVAGLLDQADHHLGVDEVLRAAEGDEADFHGCLSVGRSQELGFSRTSRRLTLFASRRAGMLFYWLPLLRLVLCPYGYSLFSVRAYGIASRR